MVDSYNRTQYSYKKMEGALYVLIKRSPGYVFKGQVVEQYFAK